MHYSRRLIIVAAIFGLTFGAHSAVFAGCSTKSCVGKIKRLYVSNGGDLYVATNGDETKLNCTSPAGVYATLLSSDPSFDRKYAILLTAFSLNKVVGVRIIENSSRCSISYVYVNE